MHRPPSKNLRQYQWYTCRYQYQVYQATYILPLFIPYGMSPQQSAANVPPISKTICRKIGKQSKDKLNRKRKVGERGKDKLGPEKKRRAPKSCGLCQRGNKFISFEGKEGCKYNITNVHLPVCAYSSDHKIRIHMCQAIIYASKISHRNYQTKTQTNNT